MKKLQINYEVLQTTYGDCQEELVELFRDFINYHGDILTGLKKYFAADNPDDYRKCLHHNASPFTYIGFPDITEAFRSLVQKCKTITSLSEISREHEDIIMAVEMIALLLTEEVKRFQENNGKEFSYMIAC